MALMMMMRIIGQVNSIAISEIAADISDIAYFNPTHYDIAPFIAFLGIYR